jgi:hypothetical protein
MSKLDEDAYNCGYEVGDTIDEDLMDWIIQIRYRVLMSHKIRKENEMARNHIIGVRRSMKTAETHIRELKKTVRELKRELKDAKNQAK